MKNSLIVITSYPPKSEIHGAGTVGIASYTKNTLLALINSLKKKNKNFKIVVLAEKLNTDKMNSYQEDRIDVYRIWRRSIIVAYFQLLYWIIRFWKTKKILFGFELSMFGNYSSLIFLPLFLFILKILGKEIFFVSHQAVDDIKDMSGHIGIERNSIKADIINILIRVFYRLSFAVVSKIIVFEEYIKEKLGKFTNKNKIIVIPHGVEYFKNNITKQEARQNLGLKDEFVILYFGFIAWYKGTDWIVERIKNQELRIKNKKVKLIIAGGVNPNHADKPFYMDYVRSIEEKAKLSGGRIKVIGFIDEKDIELYFKACDLVVLPYRAFMSSSGPLSLALSFEKPFLISEDMKYIDKNKDFREALEETKIKIEEISFSLLDDSFEKKLNRLSTNNRYLERLSEFSKTLRKKREFKVVGNQYFQEIFNV